MLALCSRNATSLLLAVLCLGAAHGNATGEGDGDVEEFMEPYESTDIEGDDFEDREFEGELVENAPSAESDLVYITSYALEADVYANGRDVSPPNWKLGTVRQLLLPRQRSHLIAVRIRMGRVPLSDRITRLPPLGFIASLDRLSTMPMKYSHTDSTWRCVRKAQDHDTSTPDVAWFKVNFDDWSWPRAESLASNGDKPYDVMEAITGEAKWIWPKSARTQDELEEDEREGDVFCRGWLSEQPDTLWVGTAPGTKAVAYANGGKLGDARSATRRGARFVLPGANNHVVGFYGKAERKVLPAFLANLQLPKPPGGVTGNLCRCKPSLHPREVGKWMMDEFDDSDWPQAEEKATHGEEPFDQVLDLSPFAKWIWTASDTSNTDEIPREAFCRCPMMASNAARNQPSGAETNDPHREWANAFVALPIQVKGTEVSVITAEDAHAMSPLEFYKEFIKASKPVKIKGGISHWPAMQKWSDEYLERMIGHEQTQITFSKDKDDVFYFYGAKKRLQEGKVSEFLKTYQSSGDKQYLAQHPLKKRGKSTKLTSPIGRDIRWPQQAELLDVDAVNLWMGPGQQTTPVHFDNNENLLCMLDGKKKFRLYEPAMSNHMYPVMHNSFTGITSRIPNVSHIDLTKFPASASLNPVFVELEAGDMLYLPAFWWHEVTSEGRNVAINWWYKCHSDMLMSIYGAWSVSLPQTKYGLKEENEREIYKEEMGIGDDDEEDGRSSDDGNGQDGDLRRRSTSRDEL